jgi:hypothetical protein
MKQILENFCGAFFRGFVGILPDVETVSGEVLGRLIFIS